MKRIAFEVDPIYASVISITFIGPFGNISCGCYDLSEGTNFKIGADGKLVQFGANIQFGVTYDQSMEES